MQQGYQGPGVGLLFAIQVGRENDDVLVGTDIEGFECAAVGGIALSGVDGEVGVLPEHSCDVVAADMVPVSVGSEWR